MSVARAVKPLENKIDTLVALVGTQNVKIDALATKVESVSTGVRNDIATLRWLVAATATVIATAGAAVGIVAKLPL